MRKNLNPNSYPINSDITPQNRNGFKQEPTNIDFLTLSMSFDLDVALVEWNLGWC